MRRNVTRTVPTIPAELRGKPADNEIVIEEGAELAPEVRVALEKINDLAWTEPDDLFGDISEVKKRLAAPKAEAWEKTEADALKRAMREGKCVLLWFTDSARSPLCKNLSSELLGKKEFGEWARENVIRFRVDESVMKPSGLKSDSEVVSAKQAMAMKEKYKARGNPTMIMLSPRGNKLATYRGYKPGTAETVWGQLKYSVGIGNTEYQSWVKSLEKQGYRIWRDKKEQQVIAKLIRYKAGKMQLVEPDGATIYINESSLCAADVAWLTAEKKRYGKE